MLRKDRNYNFYFWIKSNEEKYSGKFYFFIKHPFVDNNCGGENNNRGEKISMRRDTAIGDIIDGKNVHIIIM